MSPPCSPIGDTTPSTTSSTRWVSRAGLRTWISSSSPTTRSTGFTSWSVPTFLPLPRGVRMWSYTNASAMAVLGPRWSTLWGCLDCDTIGVTVKAGPRVAWLTREERDDGADRAAARAADPRRADQARRDERAQRALLHDQGAGPAADPARPLRLLHPRPRGPSRAGPGAPDARLHARG